MNETTAPTTSDAVVKLFDTASEAATQIGEATKGAVGLAGKARAFWSSPDFQTLATLLESANREVKQVDQLEQTLKSAIKQGSRLFGETVSMPSLTVHEPATLAQGVAAAVDPLSLVPGAAIGVGLLNVGVGVYNAVQLKKLGRQVGELQSDIATGFSQVEKSLQWQSHQIAILSAGQTSTTEQLQRLSHDLNEGLDKLISTVIGATERQIADDYHAKVLLVVQGNHDLQEVLIDGQKPNDRDLDNLLRECHGLNAWIKPKLGRTKPGDPKRLPYRVAQAIATRVCEDVRAIVNVNYSAERSLKTVNALLAEIAEDVFCLCNNRSLYWIGVECADLIAQYAYLFHGLKIGNTANTYLQIDPNHSLPLSPVWDDGMARLRSLFKPTLSNKSAWLPLRSLRDLTWYTEWAGLDPDSDLGGVAAVDLLAVAQHIGAPGRPDSQRYSDVEALLAMALPSFRHQVQARLLTAFGWQKAPSIATGAESQEAFAPNPDKRVIPSDNTTGEKEILTPKTSSVVPEHNGKTAREERFPSGILGIVGYLLNTKRQIDTATEIFFYPEIPENRLTGARSSMRIPTDEPILVLIDTTVLGGGSDGVAICKKRFFWKEIFSGPYYAAWDNIHSVKFRTDKGKLFLGETKISSAEKYFKVIEACITAMVALSTSTDLT